eukprot:Gb_15277 [translate_table: standard]
MGSRMPNAALNPFSNASLYIKPSLTPSPLPWSLHSPVISTSNSSIKLHYKFQTLFGRPNTNEAYRKWRIMAENDVAAEDSPSVEGSQEKGGPTQSSGKGFGSTSGRKARSSVGDGVKGSKEKEITPLIRRAAPEKILLGPRGDPRGQQIETVFVVSWSGLAIFIFLEGILLDSSGFLPEGWNNFFLKYLKPTFIPTVLAFVVGATAYALYKRLGVGPTKS